MLSSEGSLAPHTPHCPCREHRRSGFFHFFAPRCLQDAFKMPSFFHYFFDIVFNRFLSQLGPNLTPTWPQLGPQIHPKTHPRAVKNRSEITSYFWSVFWLICHRFFIDFRCQNQPKIYQKSLNKSPQQHNNQKLKNAKKQVVFQCFWLLRPCMLC